MQNQKKEMEMDTENRRSFFKQVIAAGVSALISNDALKAFGNSDRAPLLFNDSLDILPAPDDPLQWPAWREELKKWRGRRQMLLDYKGDSYRSAFFHWVTADFACCFIMMNDRTFYDHDRHEYCIDQLIAEGIKQYGGYDSVVLWHAYPRIGLDDRNQFDFYREMPEGLSGIHKVVGRFHQHHIKVFIDYNPWDTGTRREPESDIETLTNIIRVIDADGIFLDTMRDAPDFREKLDAVRPGIVLEGEIALPLEHIQSHHMSWAQGFKDSQVPGVYRNKWFEHCHMQHAIDRWVSDKTSVMQTAWMNGGGILIWENVFGQWLGWNERDKSIYRTMSSIQHQFSELFCGEGWTPLSDVSPMASVYISAWESDGIQLWTLVNRNEFPVSGEFMQIRGNSRLHYFDLVKGEEIPNLLRNDMISFSGSMMNRGIACFAALAERKMDDNFKNFLTKQKQQVLSASEDTTIPVRHNELLLKGESAASTGIPEGMVAIPAASLTLNMEYTFRESGGYGNIQEHLSLAPTHDLHTPCMITRQATFGKFAIDETPVTNMQFREFLNRSGYEPEFRENFLHHWESGQIPPGKEDHPVVYIDLEDARAYARWAGKRLPSEEEWQYAAQGLDALHFPWGNGMETNRCNTDTNLHTTAVKAFPKGISPFGCYDMCGNTWELTESEYSDGRSRFVMLKGGSCYKAVGSVWYTDGGPQKNGFIAKMLLMWPGLDRCATVGFRCAVDL
jgi:formylglycine-generating enzyme required for sulfatase activity